MQCLVRSSSDKPDPSAAQQNAAAPPSTASPFGALGTVGIVGTVGTCSRTGLWERTGTASHRKARAALGRGGAETWVQPTDSEPTVHLSPPVMLQALPFLSSPGFPKMGSHNGKEHSGDEFTNGGPTESGMTGKERKSRMTARFFVFCFLNLKVVLYIHVLPACLLHRAHVLCVLGANGGQKAALDPQKFELQMFVSSFVSAGN